MGSGGPAPADELARVLRVSTHNIARPPHGCQLASVILAIAGSLVGLRVPPTAVNQILIVSYPLADNSDGVNGLGPGSLDNSLLAERLPSTGSESDTGVLVGVPLLAGLGVALVWVGRRRTASVQR